VIEQNYTSKNAEEKTYRIACALNASYDYVVDGPTIRWLKGYVYTKVGIVTKYRFTSIYDTFIGCRDLFIKQLTGMFDDCAENQFKAYIQKEKVYTRSFGRVVAAQFITFCCYEVLSYLVAGWTAFMCVYSLGAIFRVLIITEDKKGKL
jgi:hypothetical protein